MPCKYDTDPAIWTAIFKLQWIPFNVQEQAVQSWNLDWSRTWKVEFKVTNLATDEEDEESDCCP